MTPFNEAATMRKVYGRLMPLLFAMMFFNYLDRINIGFAALDMNRALGFSPAVFGFAGSIFFVGYMVLEVPSNLLLHRVGARRWIARILLTWGAVAAATAFVFDDKSFYALRFLLGVMEAGFLPGVAVYLTKWFPERYRARAVGGYIIAGSFSAVLGGPISTALMTYANGMLGLQGWQWMFILEGIPAMLLGLFTLRIMTERPADADWLADDEKQWLETTLAAEREAIGGHTHFPLLRVAGDIRVWSLACLFGCALVGIYGLFLWLPQIVKSLGHLSNIEVGFLSAAPPLLGVLGTFIISRSSDRTGDRKKHLAFVYGMSAIAIAGSAYAPNPVIAYALLCATGLFIYAGNPLFWSLASSFRTGAAGAATIALINTIAQFGGLVGPWSIGLVRNATGNFKLALLTIAAFLVVATVIALVMRVKPADDEDTSLPASDSRSQRQENHA
ncbi:MFS transporter [Burkholderia sp. SFA1]|uniref:Major facilitator transporter n=1 Tax=Caballeronia cordobensis TaxID=1353886 RepID=A0A158H7Z8_CABCO|nr:MULTISPECIES: MFS transporter [Caballeronia]AET90862.1 major facilitator superfamily [Burkholderia sp. YI23]BBP98861.1 MFS transporter [Burkholderia sp. SFA1]MCE4544072.1 MFS transporter [Caballeronia sp. PC1]MCE4571223.1 MFS transporter [Caballeronia sp. CLC5]SAL40406.1 major facilitator transporter [Caballeronia cordobensis]